MVKLRRTTEDDIDFVFSVEHAPDNREYIVGWTHQEHVASLHNTDILHLIIEDGNHCPVGFVILAGLSSPNHSIEFRRIVVDRKGLGFGRAAVRAVKSWAFQKLQAHRLWLDVMAQNQRAKHLYASESFVEEGVSRECIKANEQWGSLIVMSILRREYSEE